MKMRSLIKTLFYLGILGIILSGLIMSQPKASVAASSQFEVIRQAADKYLSSGNADTTIAAKDLWDILADKNKDNDPFVLSTRLLVTSVAQL
jgi:hypothetical protein